MSFQLLNLDDILLSSLEKEGITDPTPIQKEAIPLILAGHDLRASAETGTGKTAAFLLPALQKIATHKVRKKPTILILTPTRELAQQIAQESQKFGALIPHFKTVCIFGGVPYPIQNRQLSRPYDVLVATPGRLLDHLERRRVDLSAIEMVILDEADRMLDMGFIDPVEEIVLSTPKQRQTLLFSATLKPAIIKLSEKIMNNPKEVSVQPQGGMPKLIEQHFEEVDGLERKQERLGKILEGENVGQAIVFTSTKRSADELADHLSLSGLQVSALHGDMNQRQRTRTIRRLKNGEIQVLVATDVAARGIDINTITHVINFDLPGSGEEYVHRIGRTGRAGAQGFAFSFISRRDFARLREIGKYTGMEIPTSSRGDRGGRGRPQGDDKMKPKKRHFRKFRR